MTNHRHTPSTSIGKVLLVEDDELFGLHLKTQLTRAHIDCDWFKEFNAAAQALSLGAYHAIIADIFLKTARPEGLTIIKLAAESGVASIIITSRLDMAVAKQGLNYGADFLLE